MPWIRIDDKAMYHPKINRLSDGAFRLWMYGLSYCQQFLTNGAIPEHMIRCFPSHSAKRRAELMNLGLWDRADDGVQVHDYLQWNDSRDEVLFLRECSKRRVALLRDPDLRHQVRDRDQGQCRYCGVTVSWTDRRGPKGGTYDHVDPFIGNAGDNLVVACRACNSKKGRRTPEQAGMRLQPIGSRSISRSDLSRINGATGGVVCSGNSWEGEGGVGDGETRTVLRSDPSANPELSERAGRFVERYAELHAKYRGVPYVGRSPHFEFAEALQLVSVYDDERLDKLATFWLNSEDEFANSGTRTLAKFRSRVSWCDEKLHEIGR